MLGKARNVTSVDRYAVVTRMVNMSQKIVKVLSAWELDGFLVKDGGSCSKRVAKAYSSRMLCKLDRKLLRKFKDNVFIKYLMWE